MIRNLKRKINAPLFVPDHIAASAPKMPDDRPATKQEIWDWVQHVYSCLYDTPELQKLAQQKWAWDYVSWVNFRGWTKHPDWLPGDPVVSEAVGGPYFPEQNHYQLVDALWRLARERLAERQAA